MVEGSIQGIAIVRVSDSIIQFANQAIAKMFGYASPNELVGKNLWETLVKPKKLPFFKCGKELKERVDTCRRKAKK